MAHSDGVMGESLMKGLSSKGNELRESAKDREAPCRLARAAGEAARPGCGLRYEDAVNPR